ncbi:septum site-determining protein MinC [mine drainage metagenome]|jgi:septum site-determining protein MinC|uniref:Septum site-determining protein MinC n=1 Tax=mine drainage metagenome TaxID=410659 RepID=A0A1J5RRZ7_9ZZZZ
MTSRKPTLFDLRPGAVDTLYLTLRGSDLDALQRELAQRLDAAPDFFGDEGLVLDLRRLDAPIDVDALAAWLREQRLRPIGVLADAAQAPWAGSTLARLHDVARGAPAPAPSEAPAAPAPAPTPSPAPAAQQVAAQTVLVDRALRSGQRVYAAGDLIVLGAVSHGAELIAGGNIHVYAPLRGRALAGAHGDAAARIFCTHFDPELVAVAGVYRTSEQALPARGGPAQVLLRDDSLRIEPLALD